MKRESIPVPTLAVIRDSGPERIDYSIKAGDEISIGINGRGYAIRLKEDGTLFIRGTVPTPPEERPQVVAYFPKSDCVVLTVRATE